MASCFLGAFPSLAVDSLSGTGRAWAASMRTRSPSVTRQALVRREVLANVPLERIGLSVGRRLEAATDGISRVAGLAGLIRVAAVLLAGLRGRSMAQQAALGEMAEQRAGEAAKYPFLNAGMGIATRHDQLGAILLRRQKQLRRNRRLPK